jgi:thiol-disulfide isomerase/thioredoxin
MFALVILSLITLIMPVYAEGGNSFGLDKTGFFDEEQKAENPQPNNNASSAMLDPNRKEFWALDYIGSDGRKYPPQEILNLVTNPTPENARILIEKTRLAQQRLEVVTPLVEINPQNVAKVDPDAGAGKQIVSNTDSLVSAKPQMLYFFSEHCGPCQKEEGILEKFARQNAIEVIAIPMDDQMPEHSPFRVEINPNLKNYYGVTETPTLVVVTPQGAVKNAGLINANGIETLWQTAKIK